MEMNLERNEFSLLNNFIAAIEKKSKLVRAENGLSEIVISNDFWEEMKYQMYLKREIQKGDESIAKGNFHTMEDFRRKHGLAK